MLNSKQDALFKQLGFASTFLYISHTLFLVNFFREELEG